MKDNYAKFSEDIKSVMPFCKVTLYKDAKQIMIEFIGYNGLSRVYLADIEFPEDPDYMNYHFRKACRIIMAERTNEESIRNTDDAL